jgi:cathepsin L
MLALWAALAFSAPLIKPHQEKSFVSYMREHGLAYTGDEYQFRLGLFLANSRYVQEFNAANNGFTLEVNKFAVYTQAEYQTLLGARVSSTDGPLSTPYKPSGVAAPDSYDWRTQGAVVGIKDQGQCGSCWAFSAIAAQESQYYIVQKSLQSLSEQNLVDCVTTCDGCDGGLEELAYQYIIQKQGGLLNLETDYPYTARDGTCRYNAAKGYNKVVSYQNVKSGDENDLLNYVGTVGVADVAIDASHNSFQLYKSGVYNEPSCGNSEYSLDHAVGCIGYGTDGSTAYWLVRNSWGTSWGEKGYIRMSRNKNNQCGIATDALVPAS